MLSLSSSTLASINEAYSSIYEETIEIDLLDQVVEEISLEMIDEGYDIQEIEESFDDDLIQEIIDEAKVSYGHDTESPSERRQRAKAKVGEKRAEARKAAVKGAVKKAGEKASAAKAEASRRAGNVAVRAKAGVTRAAMKATNVSPMDVPTKAGKQRKSADTFVAGRKADRDSAKAVIKKKVGDKYRGAKAAAGIAGSIAKDEAIRAGRKVAHTAGKAAQAVKDAPGKAAGAARRGLKGLIKRGAEKVASAAGKVAKRMTEEVETYDVVVEFLCDQGIAEDLQEAQWLMVNEVDSEDIETILEAYGLDEATAMAKRGYDETKLRKASGGGEAADRATSLENRPTYGDANKQRQRERYARAQRGDFRKTASSSPGLHGYAHKSNDPAVKAKQAARGAQRGALTPNEKKSFGR